MLEHLPFLGDETVARPELRVVGANGSGQPMMVRGQVHGAGTVEAPQAVVLGRGGACQRGAVFSRDRPGLGEAREGYHASPWGGDSSGSPCLRDLSFGHSEQEEASCAGCAAFRCECFEDTHGSRFDEGRGRDVAQQVGSGKIGDSEAVEG
jgi:hypothetical protein